jgi:guanylate kinase
MDDITQNPQQTTVEPGSMPTISNRESFHEALDDYSMSPEAVELLSETRLVLMVSVTAAGRNTIIEKLLERSDDFYNIVSDTTRPQRVNNGAVIEEHGVEYFFRPEEDILADLQAGRFIEAAIIHDQQVSGVSVREVVRAHATGKIAITDIEVQGCANVLEVKPNTIAIFVLPPNFEEWMRRITTRSQLPAEEISHRLNTAVKELSVALADERFVFVINDDLDETVEVVDMIAHGDSPYHEITSKARELASTLRDQTVQHLAGS